MERRGFLHRLGGLVVGVLTKALNLAPLQPTTRGGWYPIVKESFTGAWQQNVTVQADTALTYSAVFACVTLIASDIAKLCGNGLHLVAVDADDIWTKTESPAFSPVLRKPNRYQTRIKFIEQWLSSKLIHGNTYVLKERDQRGVVMALYVLDPTKVTPLVATNGDVYYQLKRDDLSGLDDGHHRSGARDHPRPDGGALSPAGRRESDLCVRDCRRRRASRSRATRQAFFAQWP